MKEIWKDVPGYGDYYRVSNLGQIKRKKETVFYYKEDRILQPYLNLTTGGYLCILLCVKGKPIHRALHTLIALTFIGPRSEGYHCHHIDGNKRNNKINNLEYISPLEHSKITRQVKKVWNGKLTKENVTFIRNSKSTKRELAEKYSCSIQNIGKILKRRCYKWVE